MLPPLYAHRLGRAYGPDSSAAALSGSLTAGVDGLETDVCLTADGALVLLHDPYLPLGTDLEGFAHERTARELRRARLRDRDGRPTAEAPLFLADLLATVPPGVVLQLEVKAHADPELARRTVEALAEQLRGRTRGRRFEVLSFEAATCARAARLGCPARLVVWADYAPAALVRWARRSGVGGVCVEHFLLSPPLMAALRRGGLSVTTGTLNDRVLLDRVLPLRPDAVTSDRPHALRDAPGVVALAA
jgi:glycerophosphoryl diester phosphodiesterase